MNRSVRPRGRVSGAPGEELEMGLSTAWTERTQHAVSQSGQAERSQIENTEKNTHIVVEEFG